MAMHYLNIGDKIYLCDKEGKLKKVTINAIDIDQIGSFTEVNVVIKEKNKDKLSVYGIESFGSKIFLDYADFLLETKYDIISTNSQYILFSVNYLEKNEQIYNFIKNLYLSDEMKKHVFKKAHNIDYLYHFTNIKNIISILKLGLYPVAVLERKNIKFERNDEKRLDGMKNCSSLSLSYPNTWYLNNISKKKNENYCIIEYDSKLLDKAIEEDLINFSKYNAARSDTKIGKDFEQFVDMFCNNDILVQNPNTAYFNGVSICPTQRKESLPLNFPSHDQAEVLIEGIIDNKYIKRIIFKDENSYNELKNYLKVYGITGIIDNRYFIKRDEFIGEIKYGETLLF